MSVYYSARLGYGFVVEQNELQWMEDHNIIDDFFDSSYVCVIDGYSSVPKYFFGITRFALDPGEIASVPINYRHNEHLFDMIDEFRRCCPNRQNYIPKDYIFCSID